MLITDQFIYIHQPKTGGTFVHEVLFKVHGIKWRWYHGVFFLLKGQVTLQSKYGDVIVGGTKHDTCSDVGSEWQSNRTFLSNIRNPLDQYVSQFEFEWWKRKEYLIYYKRVPDFEKKFPTYPKLSFKDFLELEYLAYAKGASKFGFQSKEGLGLQSQRFLRYYARNSDEVIKKQIQKSQTLTELKKDLFYVDFLRTNNLNHDLYDYLLNAGIKKNELQFIIGKKKVFPLGKGRSKEQNWEKYYTPDLLSTVLAKDKLLFDLFPEFIPKSL